MGGRYLLAVANEDAGGGLDLGEAQRVRARRGAAGRWLDEEELVDALSRVRVRVRVRVRDSVRGWG